MLKALADLGGTEAKLAVGVVLVLLTYLVYGLVSRSLGRFVQSGHLSGVMGTRLRIVARVLLLGGGTLLLLSELGAFGNAWAVVTAVLTAVAIGFFAIWSVLSNSVCALLILTFRPFQVGDEVELVEGSAPFPKGRVLDMNLVFVTLQETLDDGTLTELRVPNVLFFQKIVRRWAGANAARGRFFE